MSPDCHTHCVACSAAPRVIIEECCHYLCGECTRARWLVEAASVECPRCVAGARAVVAASVRIDEFAAWLGVASARDTAADDVRIASARLALAVERRDAELAKVCAPPEHWARQVARGTLELFAYACVFAYTWSRVVDLVAPPPTNDG